jgi:hypothetical protein
MIIKLTKAQVDMLVAADAAAKAAESRKQLILAGFLAAGNIASGRITSIDCGSEPHIVVEDAQDA